MRKILILSFVFLGLYVGISYGAQDKKESKTNSSPAKIEESSPNYQANRPILPPVVSSTPSSISPTPSPHIATPQITPQTINVSTEVNPTVPQPNMQNIQTSPIYVPTPNMPVPTVLPQVPIVGNVIGRVINMGLEKDGTHWIEVNDELFGEVARINIVDLKNTLVAKQGKAVNFEDMKTGDLVNIIFTNQNDINIASFINIMSKEELKLIRGSIAPDLTVTPENKE